MISHLLNRFCAIFALEFCLISILQASETIIHQKEFQSDSIATTKNVRNIVYLAIRVNGKIGRGTKDDPFDASGDRFDKLMQIYGTGRTKIVLGTGIFRTWGADGDSAPLADSGLASGRRRGFLLGPYTILEGAGMGKTIIKLIGISRSADRPSEYRTVSSGKKGVHWGVVNCDGIIVRDLTVDCNSTELTQNIAKGTIAIDGVSLGGNGCQVRNVEVIHPYGEKNKIGVGMEGWGISVWALYSSDCNNLVIDGCIERGTVGNYVDGIALGGAGDLYTGSGYVRNCTVIGNQWVAFAAGETKATIFENNRAIDCNVGFYFDTRSFEDISIRNNLFVCTGYGIKLLPQSRFPGDDNIKKPKRRPIYRNIGIFGNYIQYPQGKDGICLGSDPWPADEHVPQGLWGISIIQNTILEEPVGNGHEIEIEDSVSRNCHQITLKENEGLGRYNLGGAIISNPPLHNEPK
jgi:hypothetical protein